MLYNGKMRMILMTAFAEMDLEPSTEAMEAEVEETRAVIAEAAEAIYVCAIALGWGGRDVRVGWFARSRRAE